MKKILTVVLLLIAFASFAQKKKKGQTEAPKQEAAVPKPAEPVTTPAKPDSARNPMGPMFEHFVKKYTLAQRWGDQQEVKDVLYDLISETGNDSLAYTLALYYYENNQFAPSVLIAKDLLARSPKDVNILQISAAGFEGLGLRDKALPQYESIYLITAAR